MLMLFAVKVGPSTVCAVKACAIKTDAVKAGLGSCHQGKCHKGGSALRRQGWCRFMMHGRSILNSLCALRVCVVSQY